MTMPRTMSRIRRDNQEWALRRSYRASGFVVAPSGRVLARPQPLRPAANTPAPGKHRSQSRTPTMSSPTPLRKLVPTYSEIPDRLKPAYELAALEGYELNEVGAALNTYRTAVAKDPIREPVAPLRKLTRHEWSTLLSVCEPGKERAYFLRCFASKRIKLKD
jgi:hypothetical protein